jgi:hypothetical protein
MTGWRIEQRDTRYFRKAGTARRPLRALRCPRPATQVGRTPYHGPWRTADADKCGWPRLSVVKIAGAMRSAAARAQVILKRSASSAALSFRIRLRGPSTPPRGPLKPTSAIKSSLPRERWHAFAAKMLLDKPRNVLVRRYRKGDLDQTNI